MPDNYIEKIRKMTDSELDEKLSKLKDLRGISIVLQEKTRRQLKNPHWTVIPTFIIVLLTIIMTISLNYSKIFMISKKIIKYLLTFWR